ncbi:Prp19/Pso4-like-domain-containing protein [Limtongia smithiae]|uniref:Prp19/Pso4-like-domain-containing protein n=1 Tax=Limtongia smithiae TaxID=1125753 RepID=UPI0034CEA34A
MLCGISGVEPREPVVSRKSGSVYEKRLLEAYVREYGTEPITGEELTAADIVALDESSTSSQTPARTPQQASIPSLLQGFQNAWDGAVLETATLRQELAKTRQDLSTALYYHDAAVRVVARLTAERDEAVAALARAAEQ